MSPRLCHRCARLLVREGACPHCERRSGGIVGPAAAILIGLSPALGCDPCANVEGTPADGCVDSAEDQEDQCIQQPLCEDFCPDNPEHPDCQ